MFSLYHVLRHPKLATVAYSAAIASILSASPQFSAPAMAETTTWSQCAVENKTCNLSGTNQVQYGWNGKYVTKTFTGPVACDNATFGDPYPGVGKVCLFIPISSSGTVTNWARCATEGGTCVVPSTRAVRYGLNLRWSTKSVSGSASCSNSVFGDPYPNVGKVCEYATVNAVAPAPVPTPTSAVPTDSIFASASFWYKPIQANTTLHANTKGYVAEFLRQKAAYYGTVTINTYSYASPLYVAAANTITKTVKVWDCQGKGYLDMNLASQWTAVPIPSDAQASTGTDGEMTVYQPSSNTMWEFWQAKNVNGQWQACWGGQMKNTSMSAGLWPNPYGTTATGLPFVGGQITAEELTRGEIRHVIGIALVDLEKASVFSWPATRSDGYNPNGAANRIPEGSRFRLDPTVNVDALNMSTAGKVIAKAAQKYGFVVWDKAGAISIRAQNPTSYIAQGKSDPYPKLFGGKAEYAVLDGFPWDKLQFLPKDYGKQ